MPAGAQDLSPMLSRRGFLALASAASTGLGRQRRGGESRLAEPPAAPARAIAPGEHALGLGRGRDGILRVPAGYRPDAPAPLVVLLHGAGGRARGIVARLTVAESRGVIVLAPDSRGSTWDVIRGEFGPDVEFLDRALAFAFERCAIDRRRVAIGGFSDGASYALSLGVDNGTLFTHILAFSPGFVVSRSPLGRPRIFVSHGTRDEILRIGPTSRRLVPSLQKAGYAVTYREFEGPHTVPPSIAQEGFDWFVHG
jgi:phospholipase/carboxylesterase